MDTVGRTVELSVSELRLKYLFAKIVNFGRWDERIISV
jgi:hypothetical protein